MSSGGDGTSRLSTWFRDYVYIPLGGNRVKLSRHYANLMITFLISGLWHGANWTFVAWGFLHGIYLIVSQATARIHRAIRPARFPGLVNREDCFLPSAW